MNPLGAIRAAVTIARNHLGGWTVRCSHCGPVASSFTERAAAETARGHQKLHDSGAL